MFCRQTAKRVDEASAKHEGEFAKMLPKTFILTEPRQAKGAFVVAAKAARDPIQPMRPGCLSENGSSSKLDPSNNNNNAVMVVASKKRVPLAKRSHMDGVLCNIPGEPGPVRTTQTDAFVHDAEMNDMNQNKDLVFHRKRDAYSDYVEARARFSKMHSVN